MMFLDTEHPLASVSLSGRFRAASVRPPAKMVPVLAGPAEVVCHRPLVSADTPLSSALARACDLSINDFEILLRLDHAPAPGLRLSELNAAIPLTQPSLSRAVARLAQRGWLSRASAADDRRGVLITITPAGKDVLRSAVPVHAQTIRESLLDPLTHREQDLLARALSRVAGR